MTKTFISDLVAHEHSPDNLYFSSQAQSPHKIENFATWSSTRGSSPVGIGDERLHVGVALEDAHGVLGRYLAESPHRAELERRLNGGQEHLTKRFSGGESISNQ